MKKLKMSRTQKITLIRHGHPVDDHRGDLGLSDAGKKQAAKLEGHCQLVVLGPLRRHLDTYVNSNVSADRMAMSELLLEQKLDDNPYNYYRNESPDPEDREAVMFRVKVLKRWLKKQPETSICMFTSAFFMCYFIDSYGIPRGLMDYCQTFVVNSGTEVEY